MVKFSYDVLVALIASDAEAVEVATKEDYQINADYEYLRPFEKNAIPF